jgi:hypothetical protein
VLALVGNTLLCCTVLLLRTLAGLVANCYIVPVADHVLVVLCYMPIRVAFEALCDLAVSVEDLIVVELTAKQQALVD